MRNKFLSFALLSTLAVPAYSSDIYGSLSLGSANDVDTNSLNLSSSDTSYSVLLGYNVNKNFAVEVGYSSLLRGAAVSNTTATTETIDGYEVDGIGRYPISAQFSIYARLGYVSLTQTYSQSPSISITGFVYGPGIQYDFNNKFGVRLGYNIYNTSGSSGDVVLNNTSASAIYNF